jgi:glutamyl-tRNA synthetase
MFDTFDALESYVSEQTSLGKEVFAMPLRLLLTGTAEGPDLETIYPYIRCYLLEVIS